ncbi:MAG: hypothetical protein QM767_07130 [Anaeromyxobacter sp.]
MERSWYWKLALVILVALGSVYQLVPSWFYFKLPPDQRNGEAYEQSVPKWAPRAADHLTLGLDLQGGIHLALGVDVNRAVRARITRRADEIAEQLKRKEVAFTSSLPVAGNTRIEVKAQDTQAVKSAVLDYYGQELYAASTGDGTVTFAFMDKVLKDFREKAVEQAEKVIRNRIDKWGVSEPDIKRNLSTGQIRIQLPGFKDRARPRTCWAAPRSSSSESATTRTRCWTRSRRSCRSARPWAPAAAPSWRRPPRGAAGTPRASSCRAARAARSPTWSPAPAPSWRRSSRRSSPRSSTGPRTASASARSRWTPAWAWRRTTGPTCCTPRPS